jgi:hypothetical protein
VCLRTRRRRGRLFERDPIEQRLERRIVDLYVARAFARRLGHFERAAIEPLIKDRCVRRAIVIADFAAS